MMSHTILLEHAKKLNRSIENEIAKDDFSEVPDRPIDPKLMNRLRQAYDLYFSPEHEQARIDKQYAGQPISLPPPEVEAYYRYFYSPRAQKHRHKELYYKNDNTGRIGQMSLKIGGDGNPFDQHWLNHYLDQYREKLPGGKTKWYDIPDDYKSGFNYADDEDEDDDDRDSPGEHPGKKSSFDWKTPAAIAAGALMGVGATNYAIDTFRTTARENPAIQQQAKARTVSEYSPQVAKWQAYLNKHYHTDLAVDGYYGKETREAYNKYIKSNKDIHENAIPDDFETELDSILLLCGK